MLTTLSFASTEVGNYANFVDADKLRIAETLGLSEGIAKLWNDFDVLLIENNASNPRQHQAIHDLLNVVPRVLHNTSSITMNVAIGNEPPWQEQTIYPIKPQSGFNIADWDVELGEENSFPDDGPVGFISPFMAVLAHELTHGIDAFRIQPDSRLAARRDMLLRDAGHDSLNYLRSMFGDDAFQNAPHEFIASIGNQWFTDSEKTIQHGLGRFKNGKPHPINQALFMADVFSRGGDETIFYIIDTDGNVTAKDVPVIRNEGAFITGLQVDDRIYHFSLDIEGRVTSYDQFPGGIVGDANLDGLFNSTDLIQVFQAGKYEDEIVGNSSWTTGDWNWDDEFDSGDLVAAFQAGGYEKARGAENSVPEPQSCVCIAGAATLVLVFGRSRVRCQEKEIRKGIILLARAGVSDTPAATMLMEDRSCAQGPGNNREFHMLKFDHQSANTRNRLRRSQQCPILGYAPLTRQSTALGRAQKRVLVLKQANKNSL
jgi:hypothetical protein